MHKAYGDPILQSLSIEMQQSIHDCTWDEKTGRPLTKLDRELDAILRTGDDLDYVDISLITQETARPSDAIASDTFIPQLDTNTVSTFGTVKDKTTKTVGLSKNHAIDVDDKSILSGITLCQKWKKNFRACLTCSRFSWVDQILVTRIPIQLPIKMREAL